MVKIEKNTSKKSIAKIQITLECNITDADRSKQLTPHQHKSTLQWSDGDGEQSPRDIRLTEFQ